MVRITEDYVSFETAELLKEKGFDWETHRSYLINDNVFIPGDITDVSLRKDAIRIPTLQMAMKWLREKHKITIGILFKEDRIYYEIHQNNEFVFGIDTPKSYAKVCEAAIKYCLENLI